MLQEELLYQPCCFVSNKIMIFNKFSMVSNLTSLRLGVWCFKCVCRLSSSVTFLHPTQPVAVFHNQCFHAIVYASHPLTSMQDYTEIVPGEPLHLRGTP